MCIVIGGLGAEPPCGRGRCPLVGKIFKSISVIMCIFRKKLEKYIYIEENF
jgi:hypothetical protein